MKTILKPQEFYYLYSPLWSDSVEMFKYTLLGLCEEGYLRIYYKNVYINQSHHYKRTRVFIGLGKRHAPSVNYTAAEALVISLFSKPGLRLHEIKNAVLAKLEDTRSFKKNFVYPDVKQKDLCVLRLFLSRDGRRIKRQYERLMDELDADIDLLLQRTDDLKIKLAELGPLVVFLKDETLTKLGKKVYRLEELNRFFNPVPTWSGPSDGGLDGGD